MPPSHWSRPESSRLTRLRVGECVVDIPLREIVRTDGSKTRVTVKPIAVLTMLAHRSGEVVSRDALLESVWAGTLPTDDVLTQAITVLRKALGDDRDAPTYVETIPKAGYRLLAAVEWLPAVHAETDAGRTWRSPLARWSHSTAGTMCGSTSSDQARAPCELRL